MAIAYEPKRLSNAELETIKEMIAEEIEFQRIDGGTEFGDYAEIETFQRNSGSTGIKRIDTNKSNSDDKLTYYGTVIKCRKCKEIIFLYDDPDMYCSTCDEEITSIQYIKR